MTQPTGPTNGQPPKERKPKVLKPVKDLKRMDVVMDQGVVETLYEFLDQTPPRYVVRFAGGYDLSWPAKDPLGLDVLVDTDTILPNLIPGVG